MFDITSSKLLLLAIVALLVIGPKDFPMLLRTIGKYVGIIRGHAKDFRMQFDQAMRESEFSELKKDVENIAQETEASLSATGKSVEKTFEDARQGVEGSLTPAPALDPLAPNTDGLPIVPPQPAQVQVAANGADDAAPAHQPLAPSQAPPASVPATEKTGA
jgi:sec-independent protein translocase protein TatB